MDVFKAWLGCNVSSSLFFTSLADGVIVLISVPYDCYVLLRNYVLSIVLCVEISVGAGTMSRAAAFFL